MEIVAGKVSGGAGLSGFDSAALRNLFYVFGQTSKRLQVAFAKLVEWLVNGFPSWAAYCALMVCRELALDKFPVGIRPTGISDVICFAAAKCDLLVAGAPAMSECGADQLCAGLKAGIEGGMHAVSQAWAEIDTDEKNGFLVIDEENAFNSMS